MGLVDKIFGFLKSEAKDVAGLAEQARDKLDEELTKREADLEKSPSERIEDIQSKASETQDEFDRILDKADVQTAEATAHAEVAAIGADGGQADLADAISTGSEGSSEAAESAESSADAAVDSLDPATAAEKAGDPKYGKTPAQIKYEQARDAADKLLDELRGELKADGEA